MEGLGLQDKLRGGRPSSSPEPATRPPSPYYPAPPADETPARDDDLSSYVESYARSLSPPTTTLTQLVPPLGERANPIIIDDEDEGDNEDEVENSPTSTDYHTARTTFTTPSLVFFVRATVS